LDLSTAISRKRWKIGGKLVLITNRKSYMSCRFVPKSVTLNDLERRNGHYFMLFQRIRVASGAHCVKVHVRYLISWWVLVLCDITSISRDTNILQKECVSASFELLAFDAFKSIHWRFGLVVVHWSQSVKLLYVGPISTGMGYGLWVGKPSQYVTSHPGQLSWPSRYG